MDRYLLRAILFKNKTVPVATRHNGDDIDDNGRSQIVKDHILFLFFKRRHCLPIFANRNKVKHVVD